MQILETVTMGYDQVEDRIFMRAKVHREEAIVRLWITSRLLNLLVPHLVSRVEGVTNQTEEKADDKAQSSSSGTAKLEGTQSNPSKNEQIENDEVEGNATPVEELDMYLIDEVVKTLDIKPTKDQLNLIFVVKETKLSLILNQDQLKKWLTSLYRLSQQPQWSLKVWPAWVAESERTTTKAALH